MKYEHQVRMQQRHLDAIVKALKFRQQLLSGGLYETLGKVAIEARESFPEVERSPYPARREAGREGDLRKHRRDCLGGTPVGLGLRPVTGGTTCVRIDSAVRPTSAADAIHGETSQRKSCEDSSSCGIRAAHANCASRSDACLSFGRTGKACARRGELVEAFRSPTDQVRSPEEARMADWARQLWSVVLA